MRRGVLALLPVLASCGLLMDFEPGDGGEGGSASSSAADTATASTSSLDPTSASTSSSDTSSSAGGAPGSSSASSGGGTSTHWLVQFGSNGDDHLQSMDVAADGRVAVAGDFSGTLSLGDPPLELPTAAEKGTFVAVFSPEGVLLWRKIVSATRGPVSHADTIEVALGGDGQGVVIAGTSSDQLFLNHDDLAVPYEAGSIPDAYVARWTIGGQLDWSKRIGAADAAAQFAEGLAVGSDGRIVVVGGYCGTIDFSDVDCEIPAGPDGTTFDAPLDIWVAELEPNGDCRRAYAYGGPGRTVALDVDVVDDDIALAGEYDAALDFGGMALPTPSATQSFLAAIGSIGEGLVVRQLGHLGREVSVHFERSPGGDFLRFAGAFNPELLELGPGRGGFDFVTARVAVGGDISVPSVFGSTAEDDGFVVPVGDVWRAYGRFANELYFDTGDPIPIDGGVDAFATTLEAKGVPGPVDVFAGDGDQILIAAGFGGGREILAGHANGDTLIDGQAFLPDNQPSYDIFVFGRALPDE